MPLDAAVNASALKLTVVSEQRAPPVAVPPVAPYTDLYVLLWRGMRALLDGDLDAVEPCAEAMLAYAGHEPNVISLYMGQVFCLRWAQDRLPELQEALVVAAVVANPELAVFRCALAMARAHAGDFAPVRETRAELRADGFATLPRDSTYSISLGALAESATIVGDPDSARRLIDLIQPYSGLVLIGTRGLACLTTADQLLGRLHAVCGELDTALPLMQRAVSPTVRMGSPTLHKRAMRELGQIGSEFIHGLMSEMTYLSPTSTTSSPTRSESAPWIAGEYRQPGLGGI